MSRHHGRGAALLTVLALVVLVGCADSSRSEARRPAATPSAPGTAADLSKVLVVVEENHSLDEMRAGMPYLASLAEQYGYATHWSALAHPSEPNYLAMVGGSTFGVTDDRSPAANASRIGDATSIFGQALAAGRTARTYAESMPVSCHVYDHPDTSVADPRYAVRHNPWVYFTAERDQCLANDVDLTTFASDVAADDLPDIGFVIPDLLHDGHDASLADADTWLEAELAPVLASDDFTSGRLAVVVTADEDDRTQSNTVLTVVLHVGLDHRVVDTPLDHYSLTRFMADLIGVTPPGSGVDAADMRAAFEI